jgi:farnesyl-diphosphate farnesyltransferase
MTMTQLPSFASAASQDEADADAYQDAILPHVSRTFALTIPQLPADLRRAVANAYLLCRAADTIEDEPAFSAEEKRLYENEFLDAVIGRVDPQGFADRIAPRLSAKTLETERDLMAHLALVLRVTASLGTAQRAAIEKCLRIMSHGMYDFQRVAGTQGLATLRDMERYCYCVAGVVGEMLTELFLDHVSSLKPRRDELMRLALSFGQALQMTNILKDQWEDRANGVCWLPQDVFGKYGVRLAELEAGRRDSNYERAMSELIGIAHAHLRRALDYTLLFPTAEGGIRRFLLWSIGLAVLTLRSLHARLDFSAGAQVKISHRAVAGTVLLTRLATRSNATLRHMFDLAARGLPLTPLDAEWDLAATPPGGRARAG